MAKSAAFSSILSTRAQKEIHKAWDWYEDRQRGLGDRFVKEVLARIHLIEEYPDRYPSRTKSYKETPVPVFPFLILYRINKKKKQVRIVSIFHTSLNPSKKY